MQADFQSIAILSVQRQASIWGIPTWEFGRMRDWSLSVGRISRELFETIRAVSAAFSTTRIDRVSESEETGNSRPLEILESLTKRERCTLGAGPSARGPGQAAHQALQLGVPTWRTQRANVRVERRRDTEAAHARRRRGFISAAHARFSLSQSAHAHTLSRGSPPCNIRRGALQQHHYHQFVPPLHNYLNLNNTQVL